MRCRRSCATGARPAASMPARCFRQDRGGSLGPGARLAADRHRQRRAGRHVSWRCPRPSTCRARGRARALSDGGRHRLRRAAPGCEARARAERAGRAREVRLIDYRTYTGAPGRTPSPAVLRRPRRRALGGAAHRLAGACTPPACRCSPPAARPSRSSRRCCRPAAVDTPTRHLVQQAAGDRAACWRCSRCSPACVLGELVAARCARSPPRRVRLGPGDFSTSIPPGGAAEVGALARTMEDMRRNLDRSHRARCAGARRRRRRCSPASSRACTPSTRIASSAT